MADYWKSTPKYWCKHCGVYVRDTGLERANHEAMAKHQSAVKRSLREIHRNAEQKEREKDRAKQEIDRLNGVVSGARGASSSASKSTTKAGGGAYGAPPQQVSQAERQKQLEQLAELGVNIPTELRGSMAMAGEWTVTSTRVIEPRSEKTDGTDPESVPVEARATGVKRERERTEEEKEQEEAIKGLFKKPRKWGIDSKTVPTEEDAELDALLSNPLVKSKKEESETPQIKSEESPDQPAAGGDVLEPVKKEESPIKKEPEEDEPGFGPTAADKEISPPPASGTADSGTPAVVFKKRKPKNIRQK
ncbi:hypothetical protein VTH82DRAFT_7180 [Thermothelomyces myriococcoides]